MGGAAVAPGPVSVQFGRGRVPGFLLRSGRTLILGETTMGRADDGGIAHRLIRCSYPDLVVQDELAYGLSQAGIDAVVVSPSERLALTHLNSGAGEHGYELFGLDGPIRRLGLGALFTLAPMYAPPVFSPAEHLVACSPGAGSWWVPPPADWPDEFDDEAAIPSRGGPAEFGSIVLHDLAADAITRHSLRFELEPGWVPTDPEDPRWHYGATGIAFLTDDVLRIRLPDDTDVDLPLPLPALIPLPTPPTTL